jgi:Ni/Fe-hydrogenase subunit HybB-like protein
MFEVALCVMAYSTVLIIEFLPAILFSMETSRWHRLQFIMDRLHPFFVADKQAVLSRVQWVRYGAAWMRPRLEKVLIFIIVLGITLPTMHQSSLGSMLLIAATKLHPLWHTPFLPLLFLVNCIYIGYPRPGAFDARLECRASRVASEATSGPAGPGTLCQFSERVDAPECTPA